MPKVNRAKFKQDAVRGKGAKFSGWKDKGETTGWVHPQIGLWERWVHGAIPSIEERDGKSEVRRRRCNCIGDTKENIPNQACPMCQLQEFAIEKLKDGSEGDEVILDAGSGKDRLALDLNDLAGKGDYRTNPKVKAEVCFAWIAKEMGGEEIDQKNPVEIITGPHTLGERILEVIEEQVKARGETVGDCEVPEGFVLKLRKGKLVLSDVSDEDNEIPWQPYPFKLKYNPDSQPATMYSAMKLDSDLLPLTPDVAEVMLSDESDLDLDLKKVCGPMDADKQLEIIESSWDSRAIPFEEFEEFFRERSGSKRKSKKDDDRKRKTDDDEPKRKSKSEDDDEPKRKSEDDDDESKKLDVKVFCQECGAKNKPGMKFCSHCGSKLIAEEKKRRSSDDDEPKKSFDDEKPKRRNSDDEDEKPKRRNSDDESKKKVKCRDCGEMVVPMKNSGRCPECGVKLGEDDVPY